MKDAAESLPSDLAAAHAMILEERAARLEAEAVAARAQAVNSNTEALIAHLKLAIEKLRRELYGTRSERTARLLDQMELQLEDLEAAATEDELAAEKAAGRTQTVKSFERRPPALERFDRLCPPRRLFGRQFVLGRCCLQIFELKLHLIQQPRRPLRTRPVELTPQFLDRQLEMGDQGFAAGKIRLRIGRFGLGDRGIGLGNCSIGLSREARLALREDHRMRGGEIGRKRFSSVFHTTMESYP